LGKKFYIKVASLKTSRSRVESSLCEEKSTRLVIEFKMHESKRLENVKLGESSVLIAPCDGLLLKQTTGKIYTSCPHSTNVATPRLPDL
jgi:hypothetical protein